MTYENLLVSIVVALITAFVTALLNNNYWRQQFKEQEKSEYRKLYHRRKLETHERIAEYFATKYDAIHRATWLSIKHTFPKDDKPTEILGSLRTIIREIEEIKQKNIMYLSLDVWNILKDIEHFIQDVYFNIIREKKTDDTMIKVLSNMIHRLQILLRNELAIKELLATAELPNALVNEMEKDMEWKNE